MEYVYERNVEEPAKENYFRHIFKENYFRHIFNTDYDIGFGSPRTNVCSTCLQLTEKIKPKEALFLFDCQTN